MLTFKVSSNILDENRFDPSFFHPLIDKMELNSKKNKEIGFESLIEVSKKITLGHTFRRKYIDADEGVMLLNTKNVRQSLINYNDMVYISEEDNTRLKKSVLKSGDLLLTITGQFSGVATTVPKDIKKCNITANIARIILKENYDPYYLATFFNSKYGRLLYRKYSIFSTYRHIGLTDVKKMRVPFPKKKVQLKLGKYAKEAENLRIQSNNIIEEAQKKLLKILNIDISKIKKPISFKQEKNSVLDTFNPRYYSPYFNEIIKSMKKKYSTVRIGKISIVKKGVEVGSENYDEDEIIRFIRTKNLINYETDPYPDYFVSELIYNDIKEKVRSKDILITKDGKIGYVAMVMPDEKCIPASGIAIIRVKDKKYSPEYVFLLLLTIFSKAQLERKVVIGTTIPHLSIEDIKNIEIPEVSSSELKEIEELISIAFEMKNNARTLIEQGKKEIESYIEKTFLTNSL